MSCGFTFRAGGLLVLAGMAWAQEAAGPSFSLRGFGTFGAVRTDTEGAEFIRDASQPKGAKKTFDFGVDSRLGIQGNLRLGDSFEVVAQAVARRRYDGTFNPELTWAFLKWRAADGLDVRGGRLGFDVYQLADTRNVGYAHLWVRPPVEFYGRVPVDHFDGADVAIRRPLGTGFAGWKVFGGRADGRIPGTQGVPFDLTGSPLMGTVGDYQQGPWEFRLALARLKFRSEFEPQVEALLAALRDPAVAAVSPGAPALADELAVKEKWVRYASFALQWEEGPARVHLELSRTSAPTPALPRTDAGYLTVGHRWGAWTPFLGYAAIRSRQETRSTGLPAFPPFTALDAAVADYLARSRNQQRSFSAGVRWDFHRNVCFKAQVDSVRAEGQGRQLWAHPDPTWNGRATVASFVLDFVF